MMYNFLRKILESIICQVAAKLNIYKTHFKSKLKLNRHSMGNEKKKSEIESSLIKIVINYLTKIYIAKGKNGKQ